MPDHKEPEKPCFVCGISAILSETSLCLSCYDKQIDAHAIDYEYQRNYHAAQREKMRSNNQRYYWRHRKQVLEKAKGYRQVRGSTAEYQRTYRAKHREYLNELQRNYYRRKRRIANAPSQSTTSQH